MDHSEFRFLREEDYRRINAKLLEGLFFHRGDDERLFDVLYENPDRFKDFWQRTFGIDVVIRQHYAYRRHENSENDPYSGFKNLGVPDRGRFHFGWQGPDGKTCMIIFVAFLYWYETHVRASPQDENGEHVFHDHHFWVELQERLNDFFAQKPEAKPKPSAIERCFARVMRDLETFGFIMEIDKHHVEAAGPQHGFPHDAVRAYRARPGLTAYDPRILHENPSQFRAAFFGDTGEEE